MTRSLPQVNNCAFTIYRLNLAAYALELSYSVFTESSGEFSGSVCLNGSFERNQLMTYI
jgi:hypothetical protein